MKNTKTLNLSPDDSLFTICPSKFVNKSKEPPYISTKIYVAIVISPSLEFSEGEITMVSIRERGKVYEYRFEVAKK